MDFNDPMLNELVDKITKGLREGNRDEAARYMDIVIEQYPEVANILMQSVEFQSIMAENEEAVMEEQKAQEAQIPIQNRTDEERQAAEQERMINDMNAMLEKDPETLEEFIQKGTVLTITEQYDEAINCFDKALELDNDNISALIAKANAYELMGRDEDAMVVYDIVMETDVHEVYDYMSKGYILENNERFEDALECYEAALKIEPQNANILFLKGSVLVSLEKYEKAIDTLDMAIELYQTNYYETVFELANAYHNKGVALGKLNQDDDALNAFSLCLGVNAEYAPAYFEIGKILEKKEKYQKALENYEKCLEFDNTNSEVVEAVERVKNILE